VPVECFEADGSCENLYKAATKASNKSIILTRLSLRNSRTPFDPQARTVDRSETPSTRGCAYLNEPLAERVIGITKDALRRLLKLRARLVPSGLKIFGLPVTIPDTELSRRTFLPEVVQTWQSWYGIELTGLSEVELFSNMVDFVDPYTARLWKSLSPPVLLADVDFKMWRGFGINKTKTVIANASGQLNGLIVYFELMVGPTTLVSTHPSLAGMDNHWRSPVYVFINPFSLQAGDQFDVIYRYRLVSAVSTCKVRQRRAR
jgi:hypothetical protein